MKHMHIPQRKCTLSKDQAVQDDTYIFLHRLSKLLIESAAVSLDQETDFAAYLVQINVEEHPERCPSDHTR